MKSSNGVRVRFAPSPTGLLHVGNARTALFNWLFARRCRGTFILRIDDTDVARSARGFEQEIMEDLGWLGLRWDEGVNAGGEYGPYRQLERGDCYREYADRLLASGQAYPCFCTERDLRERRDAQRRRGVPPRYEGWCRDLSPPEREEFLRRGRKPVLRFRVSKRFVSYSDMVRGEAVAECRLIGDFVLVRSNGAASYNFATAVDDGTMRISHVIRGEDHVSNTPKQLMVLRALGMQCPQYAHLPLILDPGGGVLSKREEATSVRALRSAGYLPEAVTNALALLGWAPRGQQEALSLQELADRFSLEQVARAPAILNREKVASLNHRWMIRKRAEELLTIAMPFLMDSACSEAVVVAPRHYLLRVVEAVKPNARTLAELAGLVCVFVEDHVAPGREELNWLADPGARRTLEVMLAELGEAGDLLPGRVEELLAALRSRLGRSGKGLLMPIRVALTGRTAGPDLVTVLSLLGKDRCVERIRRALLTRAEEAADA